MAIGKKEDKIVVTIGLDGSVNGEVITGPGGQGCLDILDEILGEIGKKKKESKKDEFYQLNTGMAGVKVGGK